MCGIIGIVSNEEIGEDLVTGLFYIQHRGQDAAGVTTYDGSFHQKKGFGLVQDVFANFDLAGLKGKIGLGHTRYPTVGCGTSDEDAQPLILQHPYGIAIVHNGNVTNIPELKEELKTKYRRLMNTSNDVEAILHFLAEGLQSSKSDTFFDKAVDAVDLVFKKVKGSYSTIALVADRGLVAFRDPFGIRPMILGYRNDGKDREYIVASESPVFYALNYKKLRDVAPGEIIFIDKNHELHTKRIIDNSHHPCIFEYVYFARPDSVMDRISVFKARRAMGHFLAERWEKTGLEADVVIPVPDTSRTSAEAMAEHLGIKYSEGLLKNRYIGRTFIMAGQSLRRKSIKRKLTPIKIVIKGQRVILVDDSIVRGNTSREIIKMVREAGASKVYFVVASPPIKHPCIYGIDMSVKGEFAAAGHTIKEIQESIGADFLLYQDLDDLKKACSGGKSGIKEFCAACMDGKYPTGDVTPDMLKKIENERMTSKQANGE